MTQPVRVDTNVTEEGWKLTGTGGGPAGGAEAVGVGVAERDGVGAEVGDGWDDGVRDGGVTRVTDPVECSRELTSCGTVRAATTITAAPPAAMATWPILRRRARFLTRSNVPGCGSNGVTRSLSQESTSSRGSSMGFP
jgi:hypothetical protein